MQTESEFICTFKGSRMPRSDSVYKEGSLIPGTSEHLRRSIQIPTFISPRILQVKHHSLFTSVH